MQYPTRTVLIEGKERCSEKRWNFNESGTQVVCANCNKSLIVLVTDTASGKRNQLSFANLHNQMHPDLPPLPPGGIKLTTPSGSEVIMSGRCKGCNKSIEFTYSDLAEITATL